MAPNIIIPSGASIFLVLLFGRGRLGPSNFPFTFLFLSSRRLYFQRQRKTRAIRKMSKRKVEKYRGPIFLSPLVFHFFLLGLVFGLIFLAFEVNTPRNKRLTQRQRRPRNKKEVAKEKMTNEKTSARKRLTTVSQSLIGRGFFSLSFRWSFLGERSRRGLLSHHHFS